MGDVESLGTLKVAYQVAVAQTVHSLYPECSLGTHSSHPRAQQKPGRNTEHAALGTGRFV